MLRIGAASDILYYLTVLLSRLQFSLRCIWQHVLFSFLPYMRVHCIFYNNTL